uniref:Uncharacterized protein n=1 Tax=Rhizophora mucronata TaxID=61149 RepID=A0A2P2IMX0_RHIMU
MLMHKHKCIFQQLKTYILQTRISYQEKDKNKILENCKHCKKDVNIPKHQYICLYLHNEKHTKITHTTANYKGTCFPHMPL